MSKDAHPLKVVFASGQNPSLPLVDTLTEAMFNRARNLVLRACARHGTVGPSGELPDGTGLPGVLDDPDFYIVDDWYGDNMRVLVEPKPKVVRAEWVRDLVAALRFVPNWDVLVSTGEGISLLLRPGSVEFIGWRSDAPSLPGILRELREYVSARTYDRDANTRTRETQVTRLLPRVWRTSEGNPLGLVAVFRTRSDGSRGDSVWILHFEDRSQFELDKYGFEPDAVRPSLYWASRLGEISRYTPGSNPTARNTALLAEWALVAGGHAVTGARKLLITKGDQTWHFDLITLK